MRLKPALTICVATAIAVVGLRFLSLAAEGVTSLRIDRQQAAVEVISRDAAGLLVLAQDYALHQAPRAARQWVAVHKRLSDALTDYAGVGDEQKNDVEDLQDIAINLPTIFDTMKDAMGQAIDAETLARRETLIDQLVGETRRISDGAFEVSHRVTLRRQALATQQTWVATVTNLSLLGSTLLLAWLLRTRVLKPIERLRRSTTAVQGGDLTARTGYRRADEFGQLSDAFDRMTAALAQRETALLQATTQAQAANRAKTAFLAHMSHEIRTPMNAVLGLSHLLAQTRLDADQQGLVSKTQSAGRALLDVINDILDLSKIEAGEMALETAVFDLHALLADATGALQGQAQQGGLDLSLVLADELPVHVVGDAARLRQILSNLVSNALKFTAKGRVRVVAAWAGGNGNGNGDGALNLSVEDTGIGMSPEVQRRLFNPFVQGDDSITRRFGGTGLGLAIIKHLTELMGGQVSVHSEAGVGSRFEVRLPLQVAAGACSGDAPIEVLIAEDDSLQREALVALCRQLGWRTEAVDSGQALASRLRARLQAGAPPDALLVDWQLGDADGLAVVARLKREAPGVPSVVMVTAKGREALRANADAALLDQVLDKPVDASLLFDAVQQAVARRGGDSARVLRASDTERLGLQLLAGTRILVADDSVINLEVAQRILQRQGADVTLAHDGAEALACLRAEPAGFDAVLMDVQMPQLDGLAAARLVRSELGLTRLPLLALTAGVLLSERQRAFEAGMDDFVSKPFDPVALVVRLREHIERVRGGPLPIGRQPLQAALAAPGAWPVIDGIDGAQAAVRLQGDIALFGQLLRRLCEDFGDLAAPPTALPAPPPPDHAAMAARMHKLAGSAGLLGAHALHQAALAAERAARLDPAATGAAAAAVASAMRRLLDASQAWRMAAAPKPPEPATGSAASAPATQALLAEFAHALQRRELAALDRFAELAAALRTRLTPAQFDRLAASMDRLDFAAAQQILDELATPP